MGIPTTTGKDLAPCIKLQALLKCRALILSKVNIFNEYVKPPKQIPYIQTKST